MRLSPYKGKANKRFTATFKDGTTTHFGQMRNPTTKQRTVTFIDGGSEKKLHISHAIQKAKGKIGMIINQLAL